MWDELLPLLPHYCVLTWDLPGHGASQAWGEGPIAPTDLAAEALAAECNGAPLDILDGVGHVPSVEVPGRFAEKLLTLPLE
ncbi:MAG TPA: hypothetical protein VLO12_12230 [Halomonas sp.]|nr:hypothetical protein [Halomonas sp.]